MTNYGGEAEAQRLRSYTETHQHTPIASEGNSMIWCATCDERLNRFVRVRGCRVCDETPKGDMMPAHFASSACESGFRNHCSCDICF